MSDNRTALESLADMICRTAGARLVRVEPRRGQPTLIHFAPDVSGDAPTVALPVDEFNSLAVRRELQKFKIEKVGA